MLLYGATEIGAPGATAMAVLAVVVGALPATGPVPGALRAALSLLDLRQLHRTTFATAMASAALTGAKMYGGRLLLPLYLQLVAGPDTAETTSLLLAMGWAAR